MQLFSFFIQDEASLISDRLYLTAGARLDHNYYTGVAILPSVRVAWTPSTLHMFWGSVSRANWMPTELDAGSRINLGGFTGPGGVPTAVALVGNPHFNDEGLTAYEVGYRSIVNLVGNSIKFTHRGEISLTVDLEHEVGDLSTLFADFEAETSRLVHIMHNINNLKPKAQPAG